MTKSIRLFSLLILMSSLITLEPAQAQETNVKKKPIINLIKGKRVDFTKDIKPILESKCLNCHTEKSSFTELKFHTREQLIKATTEDRPILIPGEAKKSSLYLVTVLPKYFIEAMPSHGKRLTEKEQNKIFRWIEQGAKWQEGTRLETAKGIKIISQGAL